MKFVHDLFVHDFGAPLSYPPPLPTNKMLELLLKLHSKDLKQNCEHSPKIVNKLSQILRTKSRRRKR